MKKIPFYSNTTDDTHCFQAALKIVLGYFLPDRKFTFDELDRLTDKVKNKWTWPQAGIVSLINMNFEVVIIDAFNYSRFLNEGIKYLEEEYGEEAAKVQEEHSDIPNAVEHIKEMLQLNIKIESDPNLELIRKYLDKGYLVICNVNSTILNNKKGYIGHFVVVYEMSEREIVFHDPGLPAHKARKESLDKFYEAWKISKDAYAIKLN